MPEYLKAIRNFILEDLDNRSEYILDYLELLEIEAFLAVAGWGKKRVDSHLV